jgi:hypothetical protein
VKLPLAGVQLYVCWDVSYLLYFGDTPCNGETYHATESAEGELLIEGIPMGRYEYVVRMFGGQWMVYGLFGGASSFTVDSGETVDLGNVLGE